MKYIFKLTIIIGLLVQSGWAFEKVGTTSFQFLKVMTTARACDMGEAYTAISDRSDAVFFNPAGLARIENIDISVDYLDWFLDISHFAVAASYHVPEIGTFALQGIMTDVGNIQETRVDKLGYNADGVYLGYTGRVFQPGAMVLGLSYSRSLTDRFSFGITAKYAREDLGIEATQNIMFDGGLIYDTGFNSLKISTVLRNFGAEVQYLDQVIIPSHLASSDSIEQKYTGKSFPLPQTFNIGIAAYLIAPGENILMTSEDQTLLVAVDMIQPRDYDQQYNIGVEYGFKNILFLRGGY
ncbi:MAG: PorV/PorQ family protein, partial [Calditrichales bacterium]